MKIRLTTTEAQSYSDRFKNYSINNGLSFIYSFVPEFWVKKFFMCLDYVERTNTETARLHGVTGRHVRNMCGCKKDLVERVKAKRVEDLTFLDVFPNKKPQTD